MNDKTVLLVEDNPDDVELTLRSFQKHNMANPVVVATDGVEALDYLFCREKYATRTSVNPAIVMLDLKLPKLDGIEVLRQIKSNAATKMIPVIILTTSGEVRDKAACYDSWANSYIRKPVDFDQFMDVAHHLGLYWLVLNEAPPNKKR